MLLSGCGFHLRGVEVAVVDIGTVYLEVSNEHGEIEQLLLRHFDRNKVEVVTSSRVPRFPSIYQKNATIGDLLSQRRISGWPNMKFARKSILN